MVPLRRPRPSPGSLLPGSPPDTRSAMPDGSAGDTSRSRGAGSARLRCLVGGSPPPHRAPRTPGTASRTPPPPRAGHGGPQAPTPGTDPALRWAPRHPLHRGRPRRSYPAPASYILRRLPGGSPTARLGRPRPGCSRPGSVGLGWSRLGPGRRPARGSAAGGSMRVAAAPQCSAGGRGAAGAERGRRGAAKTRRWIFPGSQSGRRRRKMAPVRLCRRLPAPRDPRRGESGGSRTWGRGDAAGTG